MCSDAVQFLAAMHKATANLLADPKQQVFGGRAQSPRRPIDPYDINCGLCEDWANLVVEYYANSTCHPRPKILDPSNLTGNPDDALEYGHCFLRFNHRFYDAECPAGVATWQNLPLIAKHIAALRSAAQPTPTLAFV